MVLVVALLSRYCYYFFKSCKTKVLEYSAISLKFEGANAKTIEVRNVPLKIDEFKLYTVTPKNLNLFEFQMNLSNGV